ncbi:hypothetical protein [Riemerella columbipharyngis]|uniref:Uncharacterized protein n=1 Tax=Riemerella columbipharyngis TaxID=1071918 RepID=A0A1G7E0T0_9FLAO|nr:hypothetical protein [Riemerella columbipharyngis]SDE57242.1 hypothetical protein SAMN05421544_11359 [Riemerella columbipharyngis]
MEDYKKEMLELLHRYYRPIGEEENRIFASTAKLLAMFRGVIPHQPIGEHDVYEVLKDAGFQIEKGLAQDENGDEIEVFLWVLYSQQT